ncbi:uncharacterized protein [Cardiocondyla obscurior]|uniref:uncharacterized protein n=1 Tax=Cardiocondyla obscurior TaxID=286306 RepID=UPI00396588F1
MVEIRRRNVAITPLIKNKLRLRTQKWVIENWAEELARRLTPNSPGCRVVEAILPCLDDWLVYRRGYVTFHSAQVISGHGCFGDYLCRIGKERTTKCHECGAGRDSAQHTISVCAAWSDERVVLAAELGNNLDLPAIIDAVVADDDKWEIFSSFCDHVMTLKEENERVRREEVSQPILRIGTPVPLRGRRRVLAHLRPP